MSNAATASVTTPSRASSSSVSSSTKRRVVSWSKPSSRVGSAGAALPPPAATVGANFQQRVTRRGSSDDGSDDAWWEGDSEVPGETRRMFVEEVRKGEAAVHCATAALLISREDEALMGMAGGETGGRTTSGRRRKIPWALSPPPPCVPCRSSWYRGRNSTSSVGASPGAPRRRPRSSPILLSSAMRRRVASSSASVSAVSAVSPSASFSSSSFSSSAAAAAAVATASDDDDARATPGPVVVLGASGRTGTEVVKYCVSIGRPVRACTRSGVFDAATLLGDDALAAATVPWSSSLVTHAGADVTQPDTLAAAVAGARTVIFAATAPANGLPDEVDHLGLVNAAEACIAADVPRFVVVSGAGVTKTQSPAYAFLNMFGGRMDAKAAGEEAVRALYRRASGGASRGSCSYTVVRPSGLLDGPPKGPGALAVNQGDEAAGFINRADVAACCVEAGDAPGAAGATFEVYDSGTAVATASLSVADILSDAKLAAAVSLVTGQTWRRWWMKMSGGDEVSTTTGAATTARERRGADYPSLFDSLQRDDDD